MNKVLHQIQNCTYLSPSQTVIVGVSGGVDSVVLLHALHQLNVKCIVAHCNFHLRGEESDEDERYVRHLSATLNFPIEVIHFDTTNYAKDKSISIEMAARELRYNWFEQLRQNYKCTYILVAHNANDNLETFLLNFTRGTGIKGLIGMPILRGNILRPLIDVSRQDIEDYALHNNLQWQTDHTNVDVKYIRNNIRHTIVPILADINPSILNTMKNNMQHLSAVNDIFLHYSNTAKAECMLSNADRHIINILRLQQYISPHTLLFTWLQELSIPAKIITEITNNLNAQTGKQFHSPQYIIVIDRETLIIQPHNTVDDTTHLINQDTQSIEQPICLQLQTLPVPQGIDRNPNVAMLDADKLIFPLQLRVWQPGDTFIPFGMKGKKKISHFLTDNKLSIVDKQNTYVLLSQGKIVWVVGHRVDNRFALTSSTVNITKITLK